MGVLLVLLCLASCTGQGRSAALVLGAGSNYQFSQSLPHLDTDLAPLARSGLRQIREDLSWKTVQPAPGRWTWTAYDRLFEAAARQQVEVLPVLDYGVAWATGGDRTMPTTDPARAAYAAYAVAVAHRYGPDGTFWAAHPSLPSTPVSAVEVWNEPWYPSPADPAAYAALVRATAAALRAIDVPVRILASADDRVVSPVGNWLVALLAYRAELDGWVDVWSVHPYPRDDRPRGVEQAADTLAQVTFVRGQLADKHVTGDVWVTEVGYRSRPTTRDPDNTPASAAASYDTALRGLAAMSGAFTSHRVGRVYAFTLARPATGSTDPKAWDYGYNLVDADGSPTLALRQFIRRTS